MADRCRICAAVLLLKFARQSRKTRRMKNNDIQDIVDFEPWIRMNQMEECNGCSGKETVLKQDANAGIRGCSSEEEGDKGERDREP